jgi:UDP-N-acetylmuramate dehydrogenase
VNDAPCTANDIRAVIEHVEDEVERQHGVRMQREVHFVGEWTV